MEPSYLGIFSGPKMALYKPEGAGPFPALVLLHQCGGLRSATGSWQNMAVLDWAKEAVSRGYVTLVLDSLAPRSVDTVCMGAKNGVNFPRGVRDAYQGGEHLRKMPFVDSQRVVFAGFSWGAMVGLLSSSVAWGAASGAVYSAAISFGRTGREGRFLGTLFAVLAIAAFVRIGAVASGFAREPAVSALLPWLPQTAWLLAALLLACALRPARALRPA
jgi:hypothetical protein